MKFSKNDIIEVKIEDIGVNGEGIGKADGFPIFVKDAIVSDYARVRITKSANTYAYARLEEILEPSPLRVTPKCPVAKACGGCQIQEMDYKAQLAFKKNKVKNNIERIAKITDFEIEDTIGMDEPYYYRNKAQYPVGEDKDGNIIMGFYAGRTHSIIPCEDCIIGDAVNGDILRIIKSFMKEFAVRPYNEQTGKGLIRHILIRKGFKTGEIMVCIVINGTKLNHAEILVERLKQINGMTSISLNVNKENTNVILGNKVINLYGEGYITDYIGLVKFHISPLSFYQVNPVQTHILYGKVLEFAGLTGKETVWDLYCGVGTISLFLAKLAKEVYGVEIIPEAIEDARNNARINNISNASFFVGKAEEVLPEYYEKQHHNGNYATADVIVVDPPRKGCDERLLATVVKMQPKKIVYVSCDSATLARDLKFLVENGYEVGRVQPVDMFPHTTHVETVVMLSHKKLTV
ncbi:MAG: 23S rRNA (uracil(1939)-C(5))-methyltransferase RlmD [Lachnospiraceae bacterium]|nr:23S rRNA (uracil(1939)-C(5))-methyltransferase RlmD [Lachnospiraceae bacterium]